MIHPFGATYYVTLNGSHSMVKEADFFVSQGGHIKEWGNDWVPMIVTGKHNK